MSVAFDLAAASHLLRRAAFGADPARLERAVQDGLSATVEELLARREHEPIYVRGAESVVAVGDVEALAAWWIALILRDRAPLVERVALVWHNHFATSWDKVRDARLMHEQVQLFRRAGLGDFRLLLHEVATDPAMLAWLDGDANRKGHPNENFARELLELFGLGIGNYVEADVLEAARAFSGWGLDGRRAVFRRQHHDEGEKVVLGVRGPLDGPAAVDAVLAHPACARHVARRLLREFLVPHPGEDAVDRWSAVLVAEEWRVDRTLARLFTSEEFFAPAARRARIAAPVELLAIAVHSLGLAGVAPRAVARAAAEMGQALYRPPSVKGWDGGRAWIHAGSWLARHNGLVELAHDRDDGAALREALGRADDADDADGAVARVLRRLFPEGADDELRRALSDAARASTDPLAAAACTALTSPEFQLV